jgi:hypothetical protein
MEAPATEAAGTESAGAEAAGTEAGSEDLPAWLRAIITPGAADETIPVPNKPKKKKKMTDWLGNQPPPPSRHQRRRFARLAEGPVDRRAPRRRAQQPRGRGPARWFKGPMPWTPTAAAEPATHGPAPVAATNQPTPPALPALAR